MKNAKLALVGCGVLGLVALIVPFSGGSLLADMLELEPAAALVHVAIFALPLAMGGIALARPPLRAWQSGVALAACVLGAVRLQVWELALHLPAIGPRGVLLLAAIVIGSVAAVATLLRPEV
ncbi:MAG TPA: hypothetical protein VHW23_33650 [Kofleriaceae bacterium]|nr:hypothetical protein [Kofleriaceae bacterium]